MSRVGGGARTKPRPPQDVCADCGALEPGWASINRGILICDECCSVHRSLGRHISQVKSLKKGTWHPTQHAMVHALYSSGANGIWEHTLLDPSVAKTGRRKPQPKDPVHPTKADFIRAKHQMLSFVYRPQREEVSGTDGDVSRQLHSSVRTSNLETSLRLLSQGADPNYFYKDKNCYPLHVAARAGQSTQAELLIVYGADPGALDAQGNTPSNYASEANHPELAEHLLECQYELTDRLAFYLSGRKPDHTQGQHWIIPEMADSLDMSDLAKEARVKLQQLPNHLFEELACDVYDEVDRRETDAIWLSLQNQSALVSDRCTVPFLPVNPEYSSTRNQGRQKLARFNAREFATLIIDILNDAKRRQLGITSPSATVKDKAVPTDIPRADRAQNPFLLCPSSPPPPPSLWPPDPCLTPLPPPATNPADAYLSVNPNSFSPASLTQNNPLYRSYDEVHCSLDDLQDYHHPPHHHNTSDSSDNDGAEGDDDDDDDDEEADDDHSQHGSGGCIGELLQGHRPSFSSYKHYKVQSEERCEQLKPLGRKYSSGFSSDEDTSDDDHRFADYDEVYDPSVNQFAAQLSRSIREKLLVPHRQTYPDEVHQKLKYSTTALPPAMSSSSAKPGARSLLVRTLTMPLKYAAQHRQSLTKVFSRSQPSTPELPRRNQVARSYMKPDHMARGITVSSPLNVDRPLNFLDAASSSSASSSRRTTHIKRKMNPGVKSPAGKPPKPPSSRSSTRKVAAQTQQASYRKPPADMTEPASVPATLCFPPDARNNPILEACPTCARNVAANIQHPSIWADSENLPWGFVCPAEDSPSKEPTHKRKPSKEDCKLQ